MAKKRKPKQRIVIRSKGKKNQNYLQFKNEKGRFISKAQFQKEQDLDTIEIESLIKGVNKGIIRQEDIDDFNAYFETHPVEVFFIEYDTFLDRDWRGWYINGKYSGRHIAQRAILDYVNFLDIRQDIISIKLKTTVERRKNKAIKASIDFDYDFEIEHDGMNIDSFGNLFLVGSESISKRMRKKKR